MAAETKGYAMFTRGDCVAMAKLSASGPPGLGSSGLMTDRGLAYLVERGGQAFLSGKAGEIPASQEQVETLRTFSHDLKVGLDLPVV
jgi:hypothetical protein